MQHLRRMLLVLVLAMALVLTAACQLPNQDSTTSQKAIKTTIQRTDAQLLADFNSAETNTSSLKANDLIDVIVEVKGDSLTDKFLAQSEFSTLKDYALSGNGLEAVEQMNEAQATVKAAIENLHIEVEFDQDYTTLLNGFSATIKYGNIAAIEALDYVERVIVSEVYATPDTVTSDEIMSTMNSNGIFNSTEYTGKGILVAIIDTGVDYKHEAFANAPAVEILTKEDIESVIGLLYGATSKARKFTADNLYYSTKTPFQFDYANNDVDAIPNATTVNSAGGYHGTHVAGIAVGNGGEIVGVAPDAQLLAMKVFTDGIMSSCSATHIVAALSDCAILGVDVVNMSIGAPAGFTYERDSGAEFLNEMYALLEQLGTTVCVSAGNSYSSSEISQAGAADPSNPDIGVVGSPSTYVSSFSVASVNSYENNWFTTTEDSYQYSFWPARKEDTTFHDFTSLFITEGEAKELEVVMIPNQGQDADYEGLDVAGKVAVVQRGGTSFTDKVAVAAAHGAAVCLIYNNVASTALGAVVTDLKIPTATILMEDGEKLAKLAAEGTVTLVFNVNYNVVKMSDFSSWGCLSDLTLKPEITAPGGNIYSSLPRSYTAGQYGYVSGTSMASPNFAGLMASMREYIKAEYPSLTNIEIRNLCYQLVMSTAIKAVDNNQVVVSPRKQGAGVADINAAINTKAYLNVIGQSRTKLELGDDKDRAGIYTLNFNLVNFGKEALSYDVDAIVMTESVVDGLIAMSGHVFTDREIKISVKNGTLDGNIVTVEAGETAAIKMVITLTDEEKAYLDDNFVNGYYVEGYATLSALEENSEDLSIPFLAFYGDWTEARIFDVANVDGDPYIYNLQLIGNYYANGYAMGSYQWLLPEGYERPEASTDKLALSLKEGANTAINSVHLSLLRNAAEVHYILRDAISGYVYVDYYSYNVRKAYYNNGGAAFSAPILNLDARDYDFLNNQQLEFVITAELDYEGSNSFQSYTFPIVIDAEDPTIFNCELREENGRTYIDFDVYDNSSLMYYGIYVMNGDDLTPLSDYYFPVYNFTRNQNNRYSHDITEIADLLDDENQLVIQLADGAYNIVSYLIDFGTEADDTTDTAAPDSFDITVNNKYNSTITTDVAFTIDEATVINEATAEDHIFTIENGVLKAYAGPGGEVVIPDGVTEIAAQVFYQNRTITKLVIPEGCKTIGMRAFMFCTSLEEIVLPTETEISFGALALDALTSLTKINTAEAKVISFGSYAFVGSLLTELTINGIEGKNVALGANFATLALNLKKVTFNGNVGNLQLAFCMDSALEEVYFNGNVGNFTGNNNFFRCDNLSVIEFRGNVGTMSSIVTLSGNKLKKVEFFGDVAGIKGNAFSCCEELEEVIFHGNIGTYNHSAFGSSTKLTSFTVADGNEYLTKDYETGIVYNKDKTQMYVPSSWEYEGIFEVPETITKLDEAHFSHSRTRSSNEDNSYSYVLTDQSISWSTNNTSAMYEEPRYKLTGVKLHSGIKTLPANCFFDCRNLTTIEGLEHITSMSDAYIFAFCTSIEKMDLTVTQASDCGAGMFYGCTGLKEVILPEDISMILDEMFEGCTSLKTIELPESLFSIEMFAFYGCTALESIYLPEYIESLGYAAFYNCSSLKSINIENVFFLDEYVFCNCSSLEEIDIGPVDELYDYTFYGCSALESVTFCDGIQAIGNYCFAYTGLKNVSLPASVTSFSMGSSFLGCEALESFEISDASNIWKSVDGVLYTKAMDKVLIYPAAKAGTTYELPETVTTIGAYAFYMNGKLNKLEAANLVTIEACAFMNSEIIELIAKPVNIGESAFESSKISYVDFNETEFIDERAFYGANYLGSANFKSLVELGVYAFAETAGLKEIVLCDSIENIASGAFKNSYVKLVTIGDVKFDYAFTFIGCDIEYVELLESCNSYIIYNDQLMNSQKTVIYDYFGNNDHIEIEEGVVKIAAYAFINTENLKTLVLPSTLRVISDKAFYGCEKLTEITFNSQEAPILECAYDADRAYGYANFVCYMEDIAESMVEITINHPEHASYNNFIYATYFAKNR